MPGVGLGSGIIYCKVRNYSPFFQLVQGTCRSDKRAKVHRFLCQKTHRSGYMPPNSGWLNHPTFFIKGYPNGILLFKSESTLVAPTTRQPSAERRHQQTSLADNGKLQTNYCGCAHLIRKRSGDWLTSRLLHGAFNHRYRVTSLLHSWQQPATQAQALDKETIFKKEETYEWINENL